MHTSIERCMPKLAPYMKCLVKMPEYAVRHTTANQLFMSPADK